MTIRPPVLKTQFPTVSRAIRDITIVFSAPTNIMDTVLVKRNTIQFLNVYSITGLKLIFAELVKITVFLLFMIHTVPNRIKFKIVKYTLQWMTIR